MRGRSRSGSAHQETPDEQAPTPGGQRSPQTTWLETSCPLRQLHSKNQPGGLIVYCLFKQKIKKNGHIRKNAMFVRCHLSPYVTNLSSFNDVFIF